MSMSNELLSGNKEMDGNYAEQEGVVPHINLNRPIELCQQIAVPDHKDSMKFYQNLHFRL